MEAVSSVLTAKSRVKLTEALIDITNLARTKTRDRQSPYTEGSLSVHVELNLTVTATAPAAEPAVSIQDLCTGGAEEIGIRNGIPDSLTLAKSTRRLVFTDANGSKIQVCPNGDEVVVHGSYKTRFPVDALTNLEDEGIGYYFETADNRPAHLWLYVDAKTADAPVEIGLYVNDEELSWIETGWILRK